jgi:hypothetical protein
VGGGPGGGVQTTFFLCAENIAAEKGELLTKVGS